MRAWLFGWLALLTVPAVAALPVAAVAPDTPKAVADQEPSALLERMSHAIREEGYRGVLVFGNNHDWHTLSIQHQMADGVEYEKVTHLTGAARQMVRVGNRMSFFPSAAGSPHPTPRKGGLLDADLEGQLPLLTQNYHLVKGALAERIAGRDVVQIQVLPVDENRYGQNLWLDRDTGLLLRSDVVDEQHNVIERYQFASIDIGIESPLSDFAVPDDVETVSRPEQDLDQKTETGLPDWTPGWLPSGFSQASFQLLESGSVLMYSDGLAAFSVFIDPINEDAMPDMSNRWGATSAVVRHQSRDGVTYRITLVGEVPMATAKRIAWSVVHQEK
jgi:sigma-E factor negative regulatory protein RseB